MAAEKQPSQLHMVKGMLVPKFIDPEVLEKLKTMKLYPDDVWVVSYPKTGTTWTTQILKLIRNNGVPDDQILDNSIPWLEGSKKFHPNLNPDDLKRPRAFKSHFTYELLPCGPPNTTPCKYIYVMRNPKDTAVSYYFQAKKLFKLDWDTVWKGFVTGRIPMGNYFDHLLSWWPHRDEPNVLMLKYEDMKKNPCQAISQMATFIGADLSDEVISKIAEMTSFEKMKDDKMANMSWVKEFNDDDGKSTFMRKGVIGDWKNFLSAEESAKLDAICAEKLQGTGLEFDYAFMRRKPFLAISGS